MGIYGAHDKRSLEKECEYCMDFINIQVCLLSVLILANYHRIRVYLLRLSHCPKA
jgi:hypothetical protein